MTNAPGGSGGLPPTVARRLDDALVALRAAAESARLDTADAVREAAELAAGVVAGGDSSSAWAKAFDAASGRFDDAAGVGRDFERGPTPLLVKLIEQGRADDAQAYAVALAGIAVEACSLDPDPSLASINAAGRVARAQLDAVRRSLGVELPAAADAAAATAPAAQPAAEEKPAEPLPTLAELLAKLDALIGLKHVKEQVHRQVALLRVNQLRAAKGLKIR